MIYLMDELVTEGRVRAFPSTSTARWRWTPPASTPAHPDAHRVNLEGMGGRSLLYGKWIHYHRTRTESEASTRMKGPAVIISSSGMLSGGRILHHCRVRLPQRRTRC